MGFPTKKWSFWGVLGAPPFKETPKSVLNKLKFPNANRQVCTPLSDCRGSSFRVARGVVESRVAGVAQLTLFIPFSLCITPEIEHLGPKSEGLEDVSRFQREQYYQVIWGNFDKPFIQPESRMSCQGFECCSGIQTSRWIISFKVEVCHFSKAMKCHVFLHRYFKVWQNHRLQMCSCWPRTVSRVPTV